MFVDEKKHGEIVTLEPWRRLCFSMIKILEEHGWCQRHFIHENGARCILGALYYACRISKNQEEDWNALMDVQLRLARCCGNFGVAKWNDMPGRTQEEVLAMLRSVANDLQSGALPTPEKQYFFGPFEWAHECTDIRRQVLNGKASNGQQEWNADCVVQDKPR